MVHARIGDNHHAAEILNQRPQRLKWVLFIIFARMLKPGLVVVFFDAVEKLDARVRKP